MQARTTTLRQVEPENHPSTEFVNHVQILETREACLDTVGGNLACVRQAASGASFSMPTMMHVHNLTTSQRIPTGSECMLYLTSISCFVSDFKYFSVVGAHIFHSKLSKFLEQVSYAKSAQLRYMRQNVASTAARHVNSAALISLLYYFQCNSALSALIFSSAACLRRVVVPGSYSQRTYIRIRGCKCCSLFILAQRHDNRPGLCQFHSKL